MRLKNLIKILEKLHVNILCFHYFLMLMFSLKYIKINIIF